MINESDPAVEHQSGELVGERTSLGPLAVKPDPTKPASKPQGVTVWDRKGPERHPAGEVKLPSGLQMPPAEQLLATVDLEDWIREAERTIDEEAEGTRVLIMPIATALMTGGLLAAISGHSAGWVGFVLGFLVAMAGLLEPLIRVNKFRDRSRRVDAYRKRLRDLRVQQNRESQSGSSVKRSVQRSSPPRKV